MSDFKPTVSISIEVPMEQLLSMTTYVRDKYDDVESVTIGQLIARSVVEQFNLLTAGMTTIIHDQILRDIAAAVRKAIASPPTADGSLASMIAAEAAGQLAKNPGSYRGTATPLRQWIASEVYKAIREPAIDAIGEAVAEVKATAARAVREVVQERFPDA